MGLIRAAAAAAGGVLRDQWKEYFACDSLSNDVLIKKGTLQTKKRGLFGARNKANEDIITNGSIIAVSEGQVALIVDNGKIVEFCAEPGAFEWKTSSEPSCFGGEFFKGMLDSFKRVGYRFAFAGDTGSQQRVYYVNTKEIFDNKFGTTTPVPYDDPYYRTALYIRYYGQYSFKIEDPVLFYSAVAGNVTDTYTTETLRGMCSDEFMTALDTTLARCATEGYKFSQLPLKQREIAAFMSETLDAEWHEKRGMVITSVALAKVTPDDKSRERIEEFDTNTMHADPSAMTGGLAYARMKGMRDAASNSAGAMTGFMGFGMAGNAMGGAAGENTLIENANNIKDKKESAKKKGAHTCSCGASFDGKFCPECGKSAADDETWTCTCGAVNTGKFCSECGKKRETKGYACECGYTSDKPFKFCPDCGKKQS